jgi:2-polyprenyl-6-methoxyphenol hydroxylase-like FAD-dependent oxidoreductase
MTLATVPRYDPGQVSAHGDRAVVVGGSVAGLLAARVLTDSFESVVILERDPISEEATARRGVPQGRHVHLLEEAGRATLEDLFPGFGERVLSEGGVIVDVLSDMKHYQDGGFLADSQVRFDGYFATRPLYERIIRQRVTDLAATDLRPACQFTDYLIDDEASSVDGVRFREGDAAPVELDADLVVDATGRTSKTPKRLIENGYTAPAVDEVSVDLAYSTAVIERPAEDRRAFFVAPNPSLPRGVGMFPVENNRWLATFSGMHGDHPPTDPEGLQAFAASLPVAEPERLLDTQPWVTDEIAHYPFPSSRRHRYESLDRFPDDLVVIGDALASFNPIYGQGMSVAAMEALQLHHALADGGLDDLPLRFFEQIEAVVDVPWSIAVGGDFEFPQTTGPKPRGTDLINRYLARLRRKAHTDGRLRESLIRVFFLDQPPSTLFRPAVAWRVLKPV